MASATQILSDLSARLEQFTGWLGRSIAWLTLVMMLTMTLVVILRYGFNLGWIALQESVLYMHAVVLMLGMAYTLKADEHVRVDIFYRRQSKPNRALINLLGHLLFLFPTCIFILVMSWGYVTQSWQIMEQSQEAGGLPLVFLLKSLLLLMPILLMLQATAEAMKTLVNIQRRKLGED